MATQNAKSAEMDSTDILGLTETELLDKWRTFGPGRPLSVEGASRMEAISKIVAESPGIETSRIAFLMGLKTQDVTGICHRMAHKNAVEVRKEGFTNMVYPAK